MNQSPIQLLYTWLERQLGSAEFEWLYTERKKLLAEPSERNLYIVLGMIPRRLGKADLSITAEDLDAADRSRPGWQPLNWSVDIAARVGVLIESAKYMSHFDTRFSDLCRGGDVGERVAYYSGLPLYPEPDRLLDQVGEGLRTNMRTEFEIIAHRSPFPKERFDTHRWNHMVLKALFVDSTLHPIQGLDERANPELARILCDYAHERWAAGRPITPELWRCVGPYADTNALDDLNRALSDDDLAVRQAAALALHACQDPKAKCQLEKVPEFNAAIEAGTLTWQTIIT